MVSYGSRPQNLSGSPTPPPGPIDPYVLFEALTGKRFDKNSLPLRPASEGTSSSNDVQPARPRKQGEPEPDPQPKDIFVGCINPFALAENMEGHRVDGHYLSSIRMLKDVLQTDYEELFDMKHQSVLYAGLKLNKQERMAEELKEDETKILKEKDLVTPDLSWLMKLNDLEAIGLKGMGDARIKRASIVNNKLHLIVHADSIARTVCNREVTQTINDFCLPFRRDDKQKESFTPPNSLWRDAREVHRMRHMQREMITDRYGQLDHERFPYNYKNQPVCVFDDPIQGATANSWFIAALFSVYWSDPAIINRNTNLHLRHDDAENDRFRVKFHDKGGRNNNETQTVEVDYRIPVNSSSRDFVYCRPGDGVAIWPALYEKAFAKWINEGRNNNNNNAAPQHQSRYYKSVVKAVEGPNGGGEFVDITQTHHGDPVKAMAQIDGREPQYYLTKNRDASELAGIVRTCSVNQRTICPMVAWTYATDNGNYRGCNLVANHAYSVLGWSSVGQGNKQYIILRNPWGVTEPNGITSYPGILTSVESECWRPAALLNRGGVMAVEVGAFKEYFACLGVTK
ncbi:putative thiol protease [Rosellinia necatrix]|uniref:Putative thiol protease n=1 Tax=Rosellinia necatrix TaxID=77044 RepID=A0A1S7UJ02_ROSNE|nr:putative thiol protease [Rosellinia necatrix]